MGRRNRAFEAPELIDLFTTLQRQLASPAGDTLVADHPLLAVAAGTGDRWRGPTAACRGDGSEIHDRAVAQALVPSAADRAGLRQTAWSMGLRSYLGRLTAAFLSN